MSGAKACRSSNVWMLILRIVIIAICISAFLPFLNPARMSGLINKNSSLFTCAVSYSTIGSNFIRALNVNWISQSALTAAYIGALISGLSVVILAAAGCMSIGLLKLRRLGAKLSVAGAITGIAGIAVLFIAYGMFNDSQNTSKLEPIMPIGIPVFFALFALVLAISLAAWFRLPKPAEGERYAMEAKYRLFLMILPFLVLVALFAYLPLWGWRYAFFDYRAGFDLSMNDFVGFKWFQYLFQNEATRNDIFRVLKNTLGLSGIGIATSWLPMIFAIFLSEIKSNRPRRAVQTLTTIPNFISWVLVYSVAFAIFSTEGFLNWMLTNLGVISEGTNYLMSGDNIWLKMWAWGTWKGLGWSAIIYIAGISGIDQQLYEAATVDGAGRFRRMWHVTVPGLTSTFFVLLLLSIANVLSNGLEQYLSFYNPANRSDIQVLDLYIYQLGLGSQTSYSIPLATVVGMTKSVISVTLLFAANKASKLLRGESIV